MYEHGIEDRRDVPKKFLKIVAEWETPEAEREVLSNSVRTINMALAQGLTKGINQMLLGKKTPQGVARVERNQ
ncbi:MAG: hypothetical protein GY835_18245, partial [bacterium]|nr:hypothetical protein [bacterium]